MRALLSETVSDAPYVHMAARFNVACQVARTPSAASRSAAMSILLIPSIACIARRLVPGAAPRRGAAGRDDLVQVLAGGRRRPGLLGQRGDGEKAAGGVLEHLGGLLGRARVQLDEQVDHDPLVALGPLVLVEAHVGEELARAVVAEGGIGERVAGLGPRARLDLLR